MDATLEIKEGRMRSNGVFMTPQNFRECLAHIACLGLRGFLLVWGEDMGAYLWGKYTRPVANDGYNKDVARFICYLDDSNATALMHYLRGHLERFDLEGK